MSANSHLGKLGLVSVFSLLLLIGGSAIPLSAAASTQTSSNHETFFANLGAAPGVTTKATGIAEFWLSNDGTVLHYVLIVNEIRNVFMAHIHFQDGSIIVWLSPNPNQAKMEAQTDCLNVASGANPSPCPGFISGEFDGVLASGTITAANLQASDCVGCNGFSFAHLISAIEAGNTFVNVHTLQYPGGAIQGTIRE
jgi:CHRD domain